MSAALTIEVTDGISARYAQLIAGLGDRAGMHEAVGRECLGLTRNHLIHIAATRHATAERLGATPSGHWAQAAEKTTETHTAAAATITIRQQGIGRAAHDVTIVPLGGKKWLTIPIHSSSYNQRAYRMQGLFFAQPKGKATALLGRREGTGKGASVTWLYMLVRSVFQKQDRTLIPTDDEYGVAAKLGVRNYVDYLLTRSAGGAN
jgi:hypothetical protein